ncbi:hypothetical protein [Calothrix sp. NIES-2098]|uniref:hypothetical protein n=1 Tax=Calothrix sp. NIES-2098 TaxID=1954171 RepID=UPI000BBC047B
MFSLPLFLTYPYKNWGNFPDLFTSFPPKYLKVFHCFDGKLARKFHENLAEEGAYSLNIDLAMLAASMNLLIDNTLKFTHLFTTNLLLISSKHLVQQSKNNYIVQQG